MTAPSAVSAEQAGEVLHQHERRAQVGLEMRVPGGAGGVVPLVALEAAGVVDQHADRAERRGGLRQQGGGRGFVGEVGVQQRRRGGRGARMSSQVAAAAARLAWQCTATAKPASARASAMARPSRCAPPVTRAARGMAGGIAAESGGMRGASAACAALVEGVISADGRGGVQKAPPPLAGGVGEGDAATRHPPLTPPASGRGKEGSRNARR